MAVIPLEKVQIVVHKSIKHGFLDSLQNAGIMQITELLDGPRYDESTILRIDEALHQLSGLKKKALIEAFVKLKKPITLDQYVRTGQAYDHARTVEAIEKIKKVREANTSLLKSLEEELRILTPWQPLDCAIDRLWDLRTIEAIACIAQSKEKLDDIVNSLQDIPHSLEVVNTVGSVQYCIFFVDKEGAPRLSTILVENECELVDLKRFAGIPAETIKDIQNRMYDVQKQLEVLAQHEKVLWNETAKLEVVSDFLYNQTRKNEIADRLRGTQRTVSIVGWVRRKDLKRLENIIDNAGLALYERINPDIDEEPPVAIKNPKWSQPFEMLIRLYSMPHHKEYDPTPFLAIFFPLFFAVCLTDAIYGIFLIFFTLYLMKRVTGDKSLLWILFAGGVLTIFTGSMVGGWAGNLFDFIGIKFLKDFKDSLMLFDPIVTPMPFFYLALALGYIQTLVGILIEVYDDIRNRAYARAVFENLTWFLILSGLIAYFLFFKNFSGRYLFGYICLLSAAGILVLSNRASRPSAFDQVVWYVIVSILLLKLIGGMFGIYMPQFALYISAVLLVLEIVRIKESKKMISCMLWGLYNLYGISSFLGNILSYIRLMALGMVTGGIAMTVNLIAWMVMEIPYIGIILAIVILIIGHLFNTVINCLGGFIHTLRLQYLEFFGRFYAGGGRPFSPFQIDTKYIEVNS